MMMVMMVIISSLHAARGVRQAAESHLLEPEVCHVLVG